MPLLSLGSPVLPILPKSCGPCAVLPEPGWTLGRVGVPGILVKTWVCDLLGGGEFETIRTRVTQYAFDLRHSNDQKNYKGNNNAKTTTKEDENK